VVGCVGVWRHYKCGQEEPPPPDQLRHTEGTCVFLKYRTGSRGRGRGSWHGAANIYHGVSLRHYFGKPLISACRLLKTRCSDGRRIQMNCYCRGGKHLRPGAPTLRKNNSVLIIGLCILLRVYQSIYIETSIRNKCRCSFYCALFTLHVSAPTGGHLQVVCNTKNSKVLTVYVNGSVVSVWWV
jgi:hypothetical protein